VTASNGRLSLAGRAKVAERLRAGAGMIIRQRAFLEPPYLQDPQD